VLVYELHQQCAEISERDRAVAKMHRSGRRHAVHGFAERLTNYHLVALRDLDDHGAKVLGLHRFLNDGCDG
jgi:hypothetical protein